MLRGPSDVYLYEGRIAAVVKPGSLPNAGPAQRIAGQGRTLLPGLVDMHAHLGAGDLLLNLASGVTAVRDVGNSNATLAELRGRIDRGEPAAINCSFHGRPLDTEWLRNEIAPQLQALVRQLS